mmetsp:Transcript_7576/g.13643  ORF Transcript_7576/g.13643 Transcript_7576/m.13643 type:complete len:156 (-) Transcript_7576:63-530(-)|eukprot:CAMPEP_0182509460 /NCGR_PEP_ID=MMETSP1321-20130603/26894_1 /TAXON_ID=91990 /ORGANISM="Bolidomonas sp., Strain RCC1657" /LENGTH=155 /DNA_ID=CAMNT_0024715737 /DNA_START=442 /DNA_END=909 /DNA_ORIENTATION=-
MPHGDFSDIAGLFSSSLGLSMLFYPSIFYDDIGPFAPFFEPNPFCPGSDVSSLLRLTGSTFLFMGIVLYVNRWNTLNGKAGGLGTFIISVNSYLVSRDLDDNAGVDFRLRLWHVISAVYFMATIHLCFFANPMWTSETLKAKEVEREKKKAAKAA